MKQFKTVRIHLLILKWRFQFVVIQKFSYYVYGYLTERLLLSWEKARVIVRIVYFHSVPEVQKLSNSKIAFVNDEGVFKNNIVVVGPRMIGDPGTFRFCF